MTVFPNKQQFQHLEELAFYSDLYEGKHYERFKYKDDIFGFKNKDEERLYYIACNVTSLISEYFADMVVGKDFLIDADDSNIQDEINKIVNDNNLKVKLYESAITQSSEGFSTLRIREKNGEPIIEEIPENQYFPYFTGTLEAEFDSVTIASFIDMEEGSGKNKTYLWKEIYTKESDVVYVEYQWWTTKDEVFANDQITGDSMIRKVQGNQLSLSQSPFPDLAEGKQRTEFLDYPIYQVNNVKRAKDDFGKSDFKDIAPIINDLNFQLTQLSYQLTQHGASRLIVGQGSLDENGNLFSNSKVIEVGNGEVEPKYINNQNAQIDAVFKSIQQSLMLIAAIAKIPKEVFGLDNGTGAETATAMRIRNFNPMRKVERKRYAYEVQLKNLIRECLNLKGIQYDGAINIKWGEVMPVDVDIETNNLVAQVNSGLKSKEKAIKELQKLDTEELEAEIAQIQVENSNVFGDRQPTQAPNNLQGFLNS